MARSANVTSIDALRDFQAALVKFCDTAADALCAVQMEARRTYDWITHEQHAMWQRQMQVRRDELVQAKADLTRRRMQRTEGYVPDDTEQKKAVARAQRRIEEAEEKIENIRLWRVRLQQALNEYEGQARQLSNLLEGDPPPSVALVNRMIEALEAYLLVAPVSTADLANEASVARGTEPLTAPSFTAPPEVEDDLLRLIEAAGLAVNETVRDEPAAKE